MSLDRAGFFLLLAAGVSLKTTCLGGEAGASSSDSIFISLSCSYPSSLWGSTIIWALDSLDTLSRSNSTGALSIFYWL